MINSLNRNIGISFSRLCAICLILICHVFQAVGNPVCYFLNIGVQIFLFLSGYLYGAKTIQNIYEWYKKRAYRILIPYYIMLFIIILVNCIQGVFPSPLEFASSLLCMQWYGYSVQNAGHLWYISCILFCYFITPLLQMVTEKIMNRKFSEYIILMCGLALLLQTFETLNCITQIASMVYAYILGYLISKFRMLEKINSSIVYYGGLVSIVIYVAIAVLRVRFSILFPSIIVSWYKVLTAAFFVCICIKAFRNINLIGSMMKKCLDFCDKFSYTIYLTHHIFILGTLSLIGLTGIILVDTVLAIMCAVVCGIGIELLFEIIMKCKKMRL